MNQRIMMRLHGAMGVLRNAFFHPAHRSIILCALVALASGCGGGQAQPATYTVGGSISGLTASGLMLTNGGQTVSPAANATSFTFPTQVASGKPYSVTVQAQPTGETCTVSSGSGTVGSANVTGIVVTCVDTYSVGGSISGLTAGGLILADGSQTASPAANATSFEFPTQLTLGTSYSVTVQTQPTGETCTVSSGSGTVGSANVTNVVVTCVSAAVLYSFGAAPDGAVPTAGLIQGSDGNFYGTTSLGGATSATCTVAAGCGTVFKLTPAGVETVLYSFTGIGGDGGNLSGVIQGSDGNFYGTTSGTVFKLTPAGVETVLHSFTGTGGDGSNPYGGVIEGSDGNFYGTTSSGGANTAPNVASGCGTVFKMTPAGVETVLYSFNCAAGDGGEPLAALIQGSDGNFYGTTYLGGANGTGTVFKITPAGVETVLYSFEGNVCGPGNNEVASLIVGSNPAASLIEGSDGNFYGTTSGSLTSCGNGTVFKVTPAGVETVLYAFDSASFGANPRASLIQGSDGNFYGTTYLGGTSNGGTVFMLTPAGVETGIYSLPGASNPEASLIQTSDGSFYGTTSGGGTLGNGSVFKISK
jgi:uncharacterized repeat protein (TIGR03803 family)